MCGMCENECGCGAESQSEQSLEDVYVEGYNDGYNEAFKDARHLFWAELRIKSGDARVVGMKLKQSGSDLDADASFIIEAAYFNAAEAILRGRRDFPGYEEDGVDPSQSWRSEKDEDCCDGTSCSCS